MSLRLDPRLKPEKLRPLFARHGRLHIADFLAPESAAATAEALRSERRWSRGLNQGEKSWDFPLDQYSAMDPGHRTKLTDAVYAAAAENFQYLFDTYRVSDAVEAGRGEGDTLEQVYDLLNGEPFLSFVRAITGDGRPRFVDAQATRYLPGHFLTSHDDEVAGKGRLYAYVLNFTARWRADWGGLLLFLDGDGHVAEGYAPAFNALNIFRVPQRHAVSLVAPFAREPRLSITGWIRA